MHVTQKISWCGHRIINSFILFSFFTLLMILPTQTAYANHFRAGTMSWEATDTEDTVLIKVEVGWTNNHSHIPSSAAVGDVVTNKLSLNFGDGEILQAAVRVTSRNATTNDVQTQLVSIKPGDEEYTEGVLHTYPAEGDYVVYWGSSAREDAENLDGSGWRNETLVNIGGEYNGNSSPVTAAAAVVQVPDNQIFSYELIAVDSDGDDVQFRYGTQMEFFSAGSGVATKPTGLVLEDDGSVTWDVRDETLTTSIGDRWQMTVMAEDLDSEGEVKSYVPLDFVLLISDSSDIPPTITAEANAYSVEIDDTLTFPLTAVDPDWESGDSSPELSAINPPSSDSDIWSLSQDPTNGTTTMDVSFTPSASMAENSFVVVFQATDDAGNATTKNITITVGALDSTSPVISNVSATAAETSANITWDTDESASTKVLYGLTSSYNASTSESDISPRVTSHTNSITGLTLCTMYHYVVVSRDAQTNTATSSDATFTTTGCSSPSGGGSTGHGVRISLSEDNNEKESNDEKEEEVIHSDNKQQNLMEDIENLKKQVVQLQEQMRNSSSSSSSTTATLCTFTRELEYGMEGEDVRCLQRSLNTLGFLLATSGVGSIGNETIYFEERTYDALSQYQDANPERILTPIGLTTSTGYFGTWTRTAMEEDLLAI